MTKSYSVEAQKKIGRVMHEFKVGKLKSGRNGRRVRNRKQAIAIGISEAKKEGARIPIIRKRK